MPVLLACDLKGQFAKNNMKKLLFEHRCDVFDLGFIGETNISKLGNTIRQYPDWVAIVFCENPASISILLNEFTNVRSVTAYPNERDLFLARNRYRANVMCVPLNANQNFNTSNWDHWKSQVLTTFIGAR